MLKGYKTVLFNALTLIVFPVLDYAIANGDTVQALFSDPMLGTFFLTVVGGINVYLRKLSTTPMFHDTVQTK
jgi:hypothetical protein